MFIVNHIKKCACLSLGLTDFWFVLGLQEIGAEQPAEINHSRAQEHEKEVEFTLLYTQPVLHN